MSQTDTKTESKPRKRRKGKKAGPQPDSNRMLQRKLRKVVFQELARPDACAQSILQIARRTDSRANAKQVIKCLKSIGGMLFRGVEPAEAEGRDTEAKAARDACVKIRGIVTEITGREPY